MRSDGRRPRMPRQRMPLTAGERAEFGFLLEHLGRGERAAGKGNRRGRELAGTDGSPDLEMCLERCKARGVPLDRLHELLLCELVLDSNPPTLRALRDAADGVDEGVARFKQARRLLRKLPVSLGGGFGDAHPEALLEILDAVGGELERRRELARQLADVRRQVELRHGAKATGRPKQARPDYASLGIPRELERELRQAARYVAGVAPIRYGVGVTLTRVPDDRCPACGNPASRLFRQRD